MQPGASMKESSPNSELKHWERSTSLILPNFRSNWGSTIERDKSSSLASSMCLRIRQRNFTSYTSASRKNMAHLLKLMKLCSVKDVAITKICLPKIPWTIRLGSIWPSLKNPLEIMIGLEKSMKLQWVNCLLLNKNASGEGTSIFGSITQFGKSNPAIRPKQRQCLIAHSNWSLTASSLSENCGSITLIFVSDAMISQKPAKLMEGPSVCVPNKKFSVLTSS